MRLSSTAIDCGEKLLKQVLCFSSPADITISRYLQNRKKLGSHERIVITEVIYRCLRKKSIYSLLAGSGLARSKSEVRYIFLLGLASIVDVSLLEGLSEQEVNWLALTSKLNERALPNVVLSNLPEWIFEIFLAQHGGEANALLSAHALDTPAPIDLRVNILKSSRQEVSSTLDKVGISCKETPYSKLGLRIHERVSLRELALFSDGKIEFQDEGSQLLAQIVGAKREEIVADFCAGAGGKTLALGSAMRGTGRLYAFDISEKKLGQLKVRVKRSGLLNTYPVLVKHEADYKLERLAKKVDRVLVDVPCSGLGTMRRNPGVQWRQTQRMVSEMSVKQLRILSAASHLVKPGGRLVYSTCSVLCKENVEVIEQFLTTHESFSLIPMSHVLKEQGIEIRADKYLQLWPHLHGTDGFFSAVLIRK